MNYGTITLNKKYMNKLDKDYQDLIKDVLENGVVKKDRTGTGTISVFGRQIRHKMSTGFPMLTTKKVPFKTMVTELIWFLRGDTSIEYLLKNDCNIWTGDAYQSYLKKVIKDKESIRYMKSYSKDINGFTNIELYSKEEFINKIKTDNEFAKKWADLGPVYGAGWRRWESIETKYDEFGENHYEVKTRKIDQIQNLINDLKTNPDSRRLMVNAYNVGQLDSMTLPPCHFSFQVYTRELTWEERSQLLDTTNGPWKSIAEIGTEMDRQDLPKRTISLIFNMRSTDVGLGLPFNLTSYGLLLMILAKEVNMIPDELIYSGGDVHIYSNHVDGLKEQVTREPFELPTVNILKDKIDDIGDYEISDFELINYKSHPTIKLPLSN